MYKKIDALTKLTPILTEAMTAELAQRGEKNVVIGTIGYLTQPLKILNTYLIKYNLPPARTCILFSRGGDIAQDIHIDCTAADNLEIVDCALNFPIENCNNYMYWYQGQYNILTKEHMGPDNFKRKYVALEWTTAPQIIDKTIIDKPTLVKVSVPHNVEHVPSHRKLLTFRFVGNPPYDRIAEQLTAVDF